MAKNKVILIGFFIIVAVVVAVFCATRYCGAEKYEVKRVVIESPKVVFYSDDRPVQVIAVDQAVPKREIDNPNINGNVQVWIE